jgi:hypothetical protein
VKAPKFGMLYCKHMAREGIPVSPEQVKNLIQESAYKHEVTLGEFEDSVVKEILETLPPNPNTTHLAIWCNKYVESALEKAPQLSHVAEKIRNDVGKELRYMIDKERFDVLKDLVEKENPEVINTAWVRSRNRALSLAIRRGYKNLNGEVDWDFIAKKLGVQDKFLYKKKEYNNPTKEEVIKDLKDLLEEENPEAFSITWITEQSGPLAYQLKKLFQNEDQQKDWTDLLEYLGEKWSTRWAYAENKELLPDIDTALSHLLEALQKYNPESFDVSWIKDHAHSVHYFFRETNNKIVDFLDKLPTEWSTRWTGRKKIEWKTYDEAIGTLVTLLEKHKPTEIYPSWILHKNPQLYMFLQSLNKEEIANREDSDDYTWSTVIEMLPTEWASLWKKRERRILSTDVVVNEIKNMLDEEKPELFSPKWILDRDSSMYSFILKNINNGTYPNWESLVNKLPENLASKWFRNQNEKIKFDEEIKKLNTLLTKDTPKNWGPSWIFQRDQNLYNRLNKFVKTEGWNIVLDKVDKEYQERWKRTRQSLEDAVDDLVSLLSENEPLEFSPTWISEKDSGLYGFLRKTINEKEGNWQTIISKLPQSWQEKWGTTQQREWSKENAIGFLEELLLRKEPKKFGPAWILSNDAPLYMKLLEYSKAEGGWEFIIPEQFKDSWERRTDKIGSVDSLSDLSVETVLLLKKYNPEKFSPGWICKHGNLGRHIYKFFAETETGWQDLIALLPPEYQQKWTVQEIGEWTEEKAFAKLLLLLENNEPETFNRNWIIENDPKLFFYFYKAYYSRERGWTAFTSKLPERWRGLWEVKEFTDWTEETMKKTFLDLVNEKKPEKINPIWVVKNNINLSAAILRKVKRPDTKKAWDTFISSMPEEIQKKWTYRESMNWKFEEAINEMVKLCESNKPSKISPRWIILQDKSLYHFFRQTFRVKEGLVDWTGMVDHLPEKWRGRWKEKKVLEQLLPTQTYSNEKEIKDILDTYGNNVYTLLAASTAEEKRIREEILADLLESARAGNTNAEKYILETLYYPITEMIEDTLALIPWKQYPDDVKEVIRKCIYLHDTNGKAHFFGYVHKTLLLSTPALENKYHISLDKGRYNKNVSDYLGKYDDSEDLIYF